MTPAGHGNLVGIDLGTTMSCIARLDASGTSVTIPNAAGDPLTPSVVYLDGTTALVGRTAKDAAAMDSSKAALAVKRDMGSPLYNRTVDGRRFRPETLSAIILRKLKKDAERRIGPITKAVITVPAFFDDTRRKATEDAGRIAGFEVLDTLNEPTAAALSYAMLEHRRVGTAGHVLEIPGGEMNAVVYDLGGGTFDVTVVRLRSNRFETIATDGEVQLGGKDWDERIVQYMAQRFLEKFGIDPTTDRQRRDGMAALAERAKILLSQLTNAPVSFNHQGHELSFSLSRAQLEEMTSDLLTSTRVVTELVVRKQAGLRWDQIQRFLLVGGATHMPMIKEMLHKLIGRPPDDCLDVDQVVAQGAAVHAGILAAKADDGELEIAEDLRADLEGVDVLNVNSHSLGVEAIRNGAPVSAVLIPKNTQLPIAASKVFRLRFAGATSVDVNVLEGEAIEAANNIPIGNCCITGLPPGLPKGAPVQVRLAYGANGRVNVMALDMTHGTFAETTIERQNRLTEDDIQREAEFVNSLNIE
jgi:molecular chaperone DnaK